MSVLLFSIKVPLKRVGVPSLSTAADAKVETCEGLPQGGEVREGPSAIVLVEPRRDAHPSPVPPVQSEASATDRHSAWRRRDPSTKTGLSWCFAKPKVQRRHPRRRRCWRFFLGSITLRLPPTRTSSQTSSYGGQPMSRSGLQTRVPSRCGLSPQSGVAF